MNIELKPIAESKIRQLGGDVCGVLVRKDGRLAAVDEHGRVQWLQDGQGAEPSEDGKPLPCPFCGKQPFHDEDYDDPTYPQVQCRNIECPIGHAEVVALDSWNSMAYTQPQPAHQGSVPEGWKAAAKGAVEFAEDEQMVRDCPGVAAETIKELANLILSTTPQPEGDGWVKPDAYAVIEHDGRIGYMVMVDIEGVHENRQEEVARQFCHDHINEACSGEIEGAGSWVVRPLIITGLKRPQPPKEVD